ncbi:MAG: glutathione S-transferase family protein [Gammaproteobacteria bacterium]|nr:glutathione S-transferase family protein [Gammaproteobacteria bacterium]
MKLYTFPPSPNSLRVFAVAHELGQNLEMVPVDLTKGEHLKPEFIKLNPNHKIPILVDGDFVLWESTAIMLYLAYRSGGRLIPTDPKLRAQMHQWMSWNTAHMAPACGIFLYENLVKKLLNIGDPDPKQLAQGNEEFARFGAVLNDHLKGRGHVVGNESTIADHHVFASFVHADDCGMPLAQFAEIKRWRGEMQATVPWQKALAVVKR